MKIETVHPEFDVIIPHYSEGVNEFGVEGHHEVLSMPTFRHPRWRCNACGVEVDIPDLSRWLPEGVKRPPNPTGWHVVFEETEDMSRMPRRVWHFCSLGCVAAYGPGGWLRWDITATVEEIVNVALHVETLTECIETVQSDERWRKQTDRWDPPLWQMLQSQRVYALQHLDAAADRLDALRAKEGPCTLQR